MSTDSGQARPLEKRNRGRGHWWIQGFHVVRLHAESNGDLRWFIRNELTGPDLGSGKTLAEVEEWIRKKPGLWALSRPSGGSRTAGLVGA